MEREVAAILSPLGIDESLSRRVAGSLLKVEATLPIPPPHPSIFVKCLRAIARTPKFSSAADEERTRLLPQTDEDEDDKGLTAFLLKFGEGIEETSDARLFISAFTIGSSCALLPSRAILQQANNLPAQILSADSFPCSPTSSSPQLATPSTSQSPSPPSSYSFSAPSRRTSPVRRSACGGTLTGASRPFAWVELPLLRPLGECLSPVILRLWLTRFWCTGSSRLWKEEDCRKSLRPHITPSSRYCRSCPYFYTPIYPLLV